MTRHDRTVTTLVLAAVVAACEDSPSTPALNAEDIAATSPANAHLAAAVLVGPFEFPAPAFDIDAAPDGSILIAGGTTIREIRKGKIGEVNDVPTLPGMGVNGIAAIGRRNLFVTTESPDLARGAGVWHVSQGRVRLIGDIEAFETAIDPDAFAGPQWKHPQCEENPEAGFSAGPQSNPYHLTARSGGEALVADAAGNTLLSVRTSGKVDWIAVFTPPVDDDDNWRVLFPLDEETDCFVQPVPTSVAIGPDGALFVGELTGVPGIPGWSRVWRIEQDAVNVVCPSSACEEVVSGLTSVIDVAFGPDGMLYVVELDANGWFQAVVFGNAGGGTIKRCDVDTGNCDIVEDGLLLPGAITFDKWGQLWLLEAGIIAPVVRRVELP